MTSMDGDGTKMEEEPLDEMVRQTLASSSTPPAPPLDAMWDVIESRSFEHAAPRVIPIRTHAAWARWITPAIAAAAALLIGVGLGWSIAPRGSVVTRVVTLPASSAAIAAATPAAGDAATTPASHNDVSAAANHVRTASVHEPSSSAGNNENAAVGITSASGTAGSVATLASSVRDIGGSDMSRYLVHTAALLASLPADPAAATTDTALASRAGDLLIQTHLLLDSRAGNDPTLHKLLEDLELVLAQVARLNVQRSKTDLQLIHQAITVRDVLPRVHDAAVEASITE